MFQLLKTSGSARRGRLTLHRGTIETPIFMPVGTNGCVKAMEPHELKDLGAQIILGNTYHLFLRPGLGVIKSFGGLHEFNGWSGPILTDSGGYQIFSLGKLRKLTEEGASFQSHIDGAKFMLSPELAVEIQETLGSDIHMQLDECTPYPASEKQARDSMRMSARWAKRCREAKKRPELAQFGIVQGSLYPELRQESIESLTEIGFEGYAIGGLSVGEPKEDMRRLTAYTAMNLPADKPRYLMGVGTPLDLIESVALGVDMFDCVMPTRNARNGTLFTSRGRVNIKNRKFQLDKGPLDPGCTCHTCQTYSIGFLRHLFMAGEITGLRLLSVHNLHYYLNLMKDIRAAIDSDTFESLLRHHQSLWPERPEPNEFPPRVQLS